MKWIAEIYTADGEVRRQFVEALTHAEATDALIVPESRIRSVRRAWLSGLSESMRAVRLTAFDQVALLSTLSAATISGQTPDAVMRDFIRGKRALRRREAELMEPDLVSARLHLLSIDPQAIQLVESGEKTGSLGKSLRLAANELTYRRKLNGKIGTALIVPCIIMLLAMGAIIGLPVFFVPMLDQLQSSGISIQPTLATDVMAVLAGVVTSGWYLFVLIAIAAFVFRQRIWARVRHTPPFTIIDEYRQSLRALSFVTVFRPLYERGVSVEDILQTQVKHAKGATRALYQRMLTDARNGTPLSETLNPRDWPKFMLYGFSGFESAIPQARTEMLDSTVDIMTDRVEAMGSRISGALTTLGMVLGTLAVFLIAFGVYYPIVTASAMG